MLRTPYLPGESDMDQLKTTFRALGTPTEEEWPVCDPPLFLPAARFFLLARAFFLPFRNTTKLPQRFSSLLFFNSFLSN